MVTAAVLPRARWRPAGLAPVRVGGWPASAAAALAIDALLGDSPLDPHPVALFGRMMERAEDRLFCDRRGAGLGYATLGVACALSVGGLARLVPGSALAAGYVTVAGRGLWDAASGVARSLEAGDLEEARRLLPALVGRDPSGLAAGEIARAVVESVAENTVDGLVGPAFYTALGGATGALCYRAVNTLDSMVGYRDERYRRFGWASARLDDALNFVPARLAAALVALVRPAAAHEVWRSVRHESPAHPSPNAGLVEAAFAAALRVRLGGVNHYGGVAEERPVLGAAFAREASVGDIAEAVRCSQDVAVALGALLLAAAMLRRPGRVGW